MKVWLQIFMTKRDIRVIRCGNSSDDKTEQYIGTRFVSGSDDDVPRLKSEMLTWLLEHYPEHDGWMEHKITGMHQISRETLQGSLHALES